MTGGPPSWVSSDDGVGLKPWAHMSVKEGERGRDYGDKGGWQRRFLLVPPGGDREGRGGGTAVDGGAHASDDVGEGKQGSPKRLMPAALVLGSGG